MNHSKSHIIHERSNIIPISPSSPTNKNLETEYSLKENFFDPSKSSPPNEFMTKLELRIKNYNILGVSKLNNSDMRDIE
jgi:hypothetical protein